MRFGVVLVTILVAFAVAADAADRPRMHVSKTATCGCCAAWVEHMQDAGYPVDVENMDHGSLISIKMRLGLTERTASCHTAVVDGYVVEGHVPAEDVARLLEERPDAVGLAVPGMPIGSPGMEVGDEREPYDVLLIRRDGRTEVFSSR